MKKLSVVAWAVPPGTKKSSRPTQLVSAMRDLGVFDEMTRFVFHGRSKSVGEERSAGVLNPSAALIKLRSSSAVLSPVFGARTIREAIWVDFYDDWSLAPDINLWHRHLAAGSYKAVSAGRTGSVGAVTVNSVYMALRTGTPLSRVVPNGVSPAVATLKRTGDDRRRLLVLGHFFSGRTDFEVLKVLLQSDLFDEIVIGGPGNDPRLLELVNDAKRRSPEVIRVENWLDESSMAALAGTKTVALIPHLVSDYTLSQDLMKVYMYLALGIRVICPRLLWPAHLSPKHALLYDFGMSVADAIPEWLEEAGPDDTWRLNFGEEHSWRNRALRIIEILGEDDA